MAHTQSPTLFSKRSDQEATLIQLAPSAFIQILVFFLVFVSDNSRNAFAAVTDKYYPLCPSTVDPPPLGWKRWSAPSTWPGGVIPGVGSNMGVDAIIPCNTGVILDLSVTLNLLNITGWLKVVDAGPFQVLANYVLNMGRLTIGTKDAPYTGKIIFNLTGSNTDLLITTPPASTTAPPTVGRRVFATVGGQLELNGMYGNNPGWVTLAATAKAGSTSLTVKGDVSAWPVGGTIALASTDFDRLQAENLTIVSVTKGADTTTIGISPPLKYMHWGDPIPTGVPGVFMDESAEVALLTRSIVIQGHPNPIDPLIGGHFIVFQTPGAQYIRGVELVNMGQQGSLGRYPMHFHLCQDASASLVKDCAVHHSNQRCYVVHGTWKLNLDGNLAYISKGHCFMTEDGIEFGNVFNRNLGFLQDPVSRVLAPTDPIPAIESDQDPSTFWMANPNNTYTNNVAAGCSDSGWWFQGGNVVQGPSANFPEAAGVMPFLIPIGLFVNNAAHSNGRAGLRTYPSGFRPRLNGGRSNVQAKSGINAPPVDMYITKFRAYKNQYIGMFIHETDGLHIDQAMLADNAVVSIEFNRCQNNVVENSIFLGETPNVGNPTMCDIPSNFFGGCKPLFSTGQCGLPVDPANARANSRTVSRYAPKYGILVDQDDPPAHGWGIGVGHHVVNCTFNMFYDLCHPAAAMTANGHPAYIWPATHTTKQLKLLSNSPGIYLVPRGRGQLGFDGGYGDAGSLSTTYVWRDLDGTLVGGSGGFAVANTSALLPNTTACTAKPSWNGFACPGTCYRTITINGGPFSLVRASDGVEFKTEGSQFINILAGKAYRVVFTGTAPGAITVAYADGGLGCTQGVVLQFANPSASTIWQPKSSSGVFWQACQGSKFNYTALSQATWVCSGNTPFLQITMGSSASTVVSITQVAGSAPCPTLQCGVFLPGSQWSYSDGLTTPTDFLKNVRTLSSAWKTGIASFGYGGQGENTTIGRVSTTTVTSYYRQRFTISNAGCYDTLRFSFLASDGIVTYLNNREIFRSSNMPPTKPMTKTILALSDISPASAWVSVQVDTARARLVTGQNVLQVELHASRTTAFEVKFDMSLMASGADCPTSDFYDPNSLRL